MAFLNTQGISLFYEVHGALTSPPVLLLTGLGGIGKSWGDQIDRFAEEHFVIVPDHRGVGQSTHTLDGYTTKQLAADMASLVEHLGIGPMHVVGASTGGAIAQYMALDHPATVRSLTLCSTFARFDAFTRREFQVRRKMAAEWDRKSLFAGYALFLFSPRFTRDHSDQVEAWIERASARTEGPNDRAIALKRIDMIMAHDTLDRLGEIRQPTLVLCADRNMCTPLPLSEELNENIRGAKLVVFKDAGELIQIEKADQFFDEVNNFLSAT